MNAKQWYQRSTWGSPIMLHSMSVISSASHPVKSFNPHNISHSQPTQYLKFRTTHHENLRYLKAIGVIDPHKKLRKLPSRDAITQILVTINFFKSKGFLDADFARLALLCRQLFSPNFDITDIEPVFHFLTSELKASEKDSRVLVLKCPQLLFSDVEYCLRPTLYYLKQLGVKRLSAPSSLNAHLLNTPVEKLRKRVKFLRSIGFTHEEAAGICSRLPAIFGYCIINNLGPKVDYLFKEMERSLEELKEFPQYFAFSLEKRIAPRHLHLKERNVKIKLNRMLMWSDEKFYAKWK